SRHYLDIHPFPPRRSSDLGRAADAGRERRCGQRRPLARAADGRGDRMTATHLDEARGHFVIDLPGRAPGGRDGEVIGVDLGGHLALATSGAHLTTDDAREVVDALNWWIARRESRGQADDDTADLLMLLEREVTP